MNSSSLVIQTPEDAPTNIGTAIGSDPLRASGTACFRQTRIPVYGLFQWLVDGGTVQEYLDNFDVDRESVQTAILTAGHMLARSAETRLKLPASAPAYRRTASV